MKNAHVHVNQVTYLPQLIESLNAKGVSTDKMIKRSKLNTFDLSNPDGYIPSSFLYHFLEQVQHSQGLYSIAGRFYKDFSLRGTGTFGQNMFRQASLLQVVQVSVRFQHLLRSEHLLDYDISGNRFTFSFKLLGEPSTKRNISEDIALAQVLDTFRYVGGDNWFPLEIHTTSSSLMRMEPVLTSGDFKLYCNQPVNKVVFPLDFVFNDVVSHPTNNIKFKQRNEQSLSILIARLLKNTAPGVQLTFNQIAEMSDNSPRTLSRKLAKEGVTFNQIASNAMFKKASQLLTTTNLSVKEISQYLGYTKSPSFVRAFKNASKLTPESFRSQL